MLDAAYTLYAAWQIGLLFFNCRLNGRYNNSNKFSINTWGDKENLENAVRRQ
jgi:hypothetical protein